MSILERHYKENNKDVKKEDIEKEAIDAFKQTLSSFVSTSDLAYGSERVAYYIVAKWMQKTRIHLEADSWSEHSDNDLPDKYKCWVPAVSRKIYMGHFTRREGGLKTPKPLLDKYNLMICFESGWEEADRGMSRFYRPTHMIALCRSIKSSQCSYLR
jgi:hypothetical protein